MVGSLQVLSAQNDFGQKEAERGRKRAMELVATIQ